ncbi:hypothetical protein MMC09_002645 [Bachmanniomyces sp. S44760]|nr:hypothetical protein [Bachmanniomyces sp. S44760]
MDLAKTLIRMVVRAFYEDIKHIMVIDALMMHSALNTEDFSLLLATNQKEFRKLCGKLREDRLLSVHTRQEQREGQQRTINRDYYYIDFHETIDAIKYRLFHLGNKVKDLYKPSEEKKDYHCPRCHSRWTQLEVLDKIKPMTGEFLCHRCDGILDRDEVSAADMAGHERQSKLYSQLKPLLDIMQKIDAEVIPKNDFETALSHAVPVERNLQVNPAAKMEVVKAGQPTAVKGLSQIAAAPLEISLTTSSEKTAAEQAEDVARKANIAAQNALPVWHTNSTVTGENTLAPGDRERSGAGSHIGGAFQKEEEEESKKPEVTYNAEVAAYFAQMAAEKEKEALEGQDDSDVGENEDDDEDGEEGEDDFEDVGLTTTLPSALDTSSSSMSISAPVTASTADPASTNGVSNGNKRRAAERERESEVESGSSAPVSTNVSTPAASASASAIAPDAADVTNGPAKKKVKIDDGRNGGDVEGVDPPDVEAEGEKDSDEDEDEFEDVM